MGRGPTNGDGRPCIKPPVRPSLPLEEWGQQREQDTYDECDRPGGAHVAVLYRNLRINSEIRISSVVQAQSPPEVLAAHACLLSRDTLPSTVVSNQAGACEPL